jgi:hypothetical protein
MRATAPDIDLSKLGEIGLRSVIDAERVAAQRDCY